MKKKFLFSTLLLAGLAFGVNTSLAAPPGGHGGPHGHKPMPPRHSMHRPPVHHVVHHPPRYHHYHHVRHSGYYSPYYSFYHPLKFGITTGNCYHPMYHHGNFGATFHISL